MLARTIQNGLSLTDRSKQTGACQRAKAHETGHREGRSWVDFGRNPGVPSVRFLPLAAIVLLNTYEQGMTL